MRCIIRINFQRTIHLVILATNLIKSMEGSMKVNYYLALMSYFTMMFTRLHKSAGDIVNYSSILSNSPVTFESQRQLHNMIKAIQLLMHKREGCLSISNLHYAFIMMNRDNLYILPPQSIKESCTYSNIVAKHCLHRKTNQCCI